MIKPTVLLIPGMMCDKQLFKYQIPVLSQFAQIKIGNICQHDSIEEMADVLLHKHYQAELSVAGLSMGAIVAMEMIRQNPDGIKKTAFLNTNPKADSVDKRRLRQRQIQQVSRGQLKQVLIEEMKPNYLAPQSRSNASLMTLILKMGMALGNDVFIRQSKALANRRDYINTLSSYKGAALIISGDYDLLCPSSQHLEMAELLSNSEFMELESCGHLSSLEQPEAVNQALINWLLN